MIGEETAVEGRSLQIELTVGPLALIVDGPEDRGQLPRQICSFESAKRVHTDLTSSVTRGLSILHG